MNGLPDKLLVGAIVLAATWYAVRTLGSRSWRRRRGATGSAAQGAACGGCDGCASTPATAAETRVPLDAIGHRQPTRTTPRT